MKQLTSRGAASVKTLVCGKDYMREGEDHCSFGQGEPYVSHIAYRPTKTTQASWCPHSSFISRDSIQLNLQEAHLDDMLRECDVLILSHGVRDSTFTGCFDGNYLSQVNCKSYQCDLNCTRRTPATTHNPTHSVTCIRIGRADREVPAQIPRAGYDSQEERHLP